MLVDKLSDSKSVVRDAVLECCALLIDKFTPNSFMNQVIKQFQNTNWHVREGLQHLFARCLIETAEADSDITSLLSMKAVEELAFSLKIEDKQKLNQMAIDNFAFGLYLSQDKTTFISQIQKGLGIKQGQEDRENELLDQIYFRNEVQAFPAIAMPSGKIQFQQWMTRAEDNAEQYEDQSVKVIQPKPNYEQEKNLKIDVHIHELKLPNFEVTPNTNSLLSPKDYGQPIEQMHFQQNPISFEQIHQQANVQMNKTSVSTQLPIQQHSQFIGNQNFIVSFESRSHGTQNQIIRPPQQQEVPIWLPTFSNQQPNMTQYDDVQRQSSRKSDQTQQLFTKLESTGSDQMQIISPIQHHQTAAKVVRNIDQTSNRVQAQKNETPMTIVKFGGDDGLSTFTSATLVSSSNKSDPLTRLPVKKQTSEDNRSNMFSDVKQQNIQTQDNFRQAFGQSQQLVPVANQTNYIPEQHKSQPRSIQSNQDKQRLLANSTNSTGSNSNLNKISAQTSTSQVNTFEKNQINDRLTLLKSNFKNKSIEQPQFVEHTPKQLTHNVNMYTHPDDRRITGTGGVVNTSLYDDQNSDQGGVYGQNRRSGPIRAPSNRLPEEQKFLKKNISQQPPQIQSTSVQPRQAVSAVKPPAYIHNQRIISDSHSEIPIKFDISHERNSSIEYQQPLDNLSIQPQGLQSTAKKQIKPSSQTEIKINEEFHLNATDNVGADYTLIEEPLHNPQQALTTAIADLKSADWQKQFDACNIIRRVSIFHSQLFATNSQVYKELIKPVDSLRSQVSKNACLAMQQLFASLQSKETDQYVDTVLPILLKRAVDTNQFIAESAEQTLEIIVKNCTETRVFASLQTQTLKNNKQKEIVCYCYAMLIEKLQNIGRFKQFGSTERLIQQIVTMLGESSIDVRNQAKLCVLKLQNASGGAREFQGLLQKLHLNERQLELIQKVIKTEDLENLNQNFNTRYGGMRGVPAPMGQTQMKKTTGSNDDFSRRSAGKGSQMGQTFISGNQSIGQPNPSSIGNFHTPATHNESIYSGLDSQKQNQGFAYAIDSTQTTFKNRNASVSKPIDRDLMENFKGLVDNCSSNDWQQRLKAIDELQKWIEQNSRKIKSSQPGSFIQLVDIYCTLIQDNNAKVQSWALQSFDTALTQNLCSTNQNVRTHNEKLFNQLERVVIQENNGVSNTLVQPIFNLINLNNCKAKPQLVQRLSNLIQRVDKVVLVDRYVSPLVQPSNKIQQEANGNQQLRSALAKLEQQVQNYQIK